MIAHASALIAASAGIALTMGTLHLVFTFHGRRFHPREPGVKEQLERSTMFMTRDTSFWNVWIGFNASHSLGVMLFGLVYGYLALTSAEFLFQSRFLLALGFCFLASFLVLAKRYWFSVPFRGLMLSSTCYALGLFMAG